MENNHLSSYLVIIVIAVVIILVLLLAIYIMNRTTKNNMLNYFRIHPLNPKYQHSRESFNPRRNYPQPQDSAFKTQEELTNIFYAADSTEFVNNATDIKDSYYADNIAPNRI